MAQEVFHAFWAACISAVLPCQAGFLGMVCEAGDWGWCLIRGFGIVCEHALGDCAWLGTWSSSISMQNSSCLLLQTDWAGLVTCPDDNVAFCNP